MQLDDFNLVERGPRLFDAWESRTSIISPVGAFKIEFQVEIGNQPTPDMFAAAEKLLAKFQTDKGDLANRIFESYLALCADPIDHDWLAECDVPIGLLMHELSEFIDARYLTIDDELNMSVYMSPKWDIEHGLYFDLVDGEWRADE